MLDALAVAAKAVDQMKLTMDYFSRGDVPFTDRDRVLLVDFTIEFNGSIRVRPLGLEGWVPV